jgi:hypothetical protein
VGLQGVLAAAAGSAGQRLLLHVLQLWVILLLLLLKGHGCLMQQSCMEGVNACSKTGQKTLECDKGKRVEDAAAAAEGSLLPIVTVLHRMGIRVQIYSIKARAVALANIICGLLDREPHDKVQPFRWHKGALAATYASHAIQHSGIDTALLPEPQASCMLLSHQADTSNLPQPLHTDLWEHG